MWTLDQRSTVQDDGADVVATVFTDESMSGALGSITLRGVGTGSVVSFADIDGLAEIRVVVTP